MAELIDVRLIGDDGEVLRRFMTRVRRVESGCWLWTGGKMSSGYGQLLIARRSWLAHRAAWRLFVGELPPGMYVCHRCDVPACVNPEHLFLGTQFDNMRDMASKGRHRAVTRPDLVRRGRDVSTAVLTEDAVRAIRRDPRGSVTIGREYGVSRHTIRLVKRRKVWGHVV